MQATLRTRGTNTSRRKAAEQNPASFVGKQAGGKIAIIKDPFSDNPVFLGTTTPIVGASIDKLTISADGTRLFADLKDWGVNPTDSMTSGMLMWNHPVFVTRHRGHAVVRMQINSAIRSVIDGELDPASTEYDGQMAEEV